MVQARSATAVSSVIVSKKGKRSKKKKTLKKDKSTTSVIKHERSAILNHHFETNESPKKSKEPNVIFDSDNLLDMAIQKLEEDHSSVGLDLRQILNSTIHADFNK